MGNSELHVEAGIWQDIAVLVMEGEAADRKNGGGMAADALYRVVLARGLRLATDVVHLDPRPVRGWRLVVDHAGAVTLTWPHRSPLFGPGSRHDRRRVPSSSTPYRRLRHADPGTNVELAGPG